MYCSFPVGAHPLPIVATVDPPFLLPLLCLSLCVWGLWCGKVREEGIGGGMEEQAASRWEGGRSCAQVVGLVKELSAGGQREQVAGHQEGDRSCGLVVGLLE